MKSELKKNCFIITPIGADGSEIRTEITGVIESVIKPTLENEYNVKAAHLSLSSVQITKEIIEDIFNADLIIANLTGANPNVMYELSFAHALRKPVVHIIKDGETPPFDINEQRYLNYTDNMLGVTELKAKLFDYVQEAMKDKTGKRVSNPITDSIDSITIKSESYDTSVSETLKVVLNRLESIEKTQQMNSFFDVRSNYDKKLDKNGDIFRTRRNCFELCTNPNERKKIIKYILSSSIIDVINLNESKVDDEGCYQIEVKYNYNGAYNNDFFVGELETFVKKLGVTNFKQLY